MQESEQIEPEITEGDAHGGFRMAGGDIIREDGTCAGYTALDFQAWFNAQQAAITAARVALEEYMSQFGQALEAHDIPFGPDQKAADAQARAALAHLRALEGAQ